MPTIGDLCKGQVFRDWIAGLGSRVREQHPSSLHLYPTDCMVLCASLLLSLVPLTGKRCKQLQSDKPYPQAQVREVQQVAQVQQQPYRLDTTVTEASYQDKQNT